MIEYHQTLLEIAREYRRLKPPATSCRINDSEACIYMYQQVTSQVNEPIHIAIYSLISSYLINIERDNHYFEFIEKILEFHNYNKSMVVREIISLSIHGIDNNLSRQKFYFYITYVIPMILNDIVEYKDSNAFFDYLGIVEGIIRVNDVVLIKSYAILTVALLRIMIEENSSELNQTLLNYSPLFHVFFNSGETNSDDREYFAEIINYCDKLAKLSNEH